MSRMDAGGSGSSKAMGPQMQLLMHYLIAADPFETDDRIKEWEAARDGFQEAATYLRVAARKMGEVFEETSLTTEAAQRKLMRAADGYDDKATQLDAAIRKLAPARERMEKAQDKYDELVLTLPDSFGPAPDPNNPKYATSGLGISKAAGTANAQALADAQAQHAAEAAAIANAEREAAHHKSEMAAGYAESQPPVRAITDEPSKDGQSGSGGGGTGGSSSVGAPFGQGSYSAATAAQAKIDHGMAIRGNDMSQHYIDTGKSELQAAQAANQPEWNDSRGWIGADGSPSEVTEYASVVSSEGIAPLSSNASGLGGMAAVGVGLGGAALAAGIAKAVKGGMLARAAAAGGTTGRTTPSTATQRPGAGQPTRAGGTQAGRGATSGRNLAGAGNRSQMARGGGAGGRGGKGKDKDGANSDIDRMADYSKDYSDEEYEKLVERQRQDEEQRNRFRPEGNE